MSALQDLFLPDARRTGQVVAEFDMGSTDPGKTQYPGGYCAGLTIHWLSLRATGQAWPRDQASTYGADIAKKAAATYTTYRDGQNKTQMQAPLPGVIVRGLSTATGASALTGIDDTDLFQLKGALNAVLGDFKMTIDGNFEPMAWSGQEGRHFMHEVAVRGMGLYYISIATKLQGQGDGSHAVGLHVRSRSLDSACDFFDPNVGHLAYANPDQLRWGFDRLLRSYATVHNFHFYRGHALRLTPPALQLRTAP
jgi:hypothetical protein